MPSEISRAGTPCGSESESGSHRRRSGSGELRDVLAQLAAQMKDQSAQLAKLNSFMESTTKNNSSKESAEVLPGPPPGTPPPEARYRNPL